MPAEQSNEKVKRWKLRGRVSGAPGPLSHLVVAVVEGASLAEHETVEVIPADSPQVIGIEEARLLRRVWREDITSAEETRIAGILDRIARFAEEADRG